MRKKIGAPASVVYSGRLRILTAWVMEAPLQYSLADMEGERGGALRWEVEQVATQLAVRVSEKVMGMPFYRVIKELLPSERTNLFFEMRVKGEIYPLVRTLCVLQWYARHGQSVSEPRVICLILLFHLSRGKRRLPRSGSDRLLGAFGLGPKCSGRRLGAGGSGTNVRY
jgi:hypothetical protein